MDDTPKLTGKEAVLFAKDHFGVQSRYAMAKALSGDGLTVQTIQISNYLRGTQMSAKVADRFYEVYGIIITDAYRPSDWSENTLGEFYALLPEEATDSGSAETSDEQYD